MYDDFDPIPLDCSSSKCKINDISNKLVDCEGCGKKILSLDKGYCSDCLDVQLSRFLSYSEFNWVVDKDKNHIIRDKNSNAVVCTLVDFPLCRNTFGKLIANGPIFLGRSLKMKKCLTEILEENDIERIKDLADSTLKDLNKEIK